MGARLAADSEECKSNKSSANSSKINLAEVDDLSLTSEDYLDRDEKNCYITMMSVGDTGRGPLIVLGYPFLRKYYTMFDFFKNRLEFVPSEGVSASIKTEKESSGILLKG